MHDRFYSPPPGEINRRSRDSHWKNERGPFFRLALIIMCVGTIVAGQSLAGSPHAVEHARTL